MAEERRSRAGRLLEVDLPNRLETFAEAMRLGAVQLVARQLLRAGIFRVSLDLGGSRNVSEEAAVEAIKRIIAARPKLQGFVRKYWNILIEQVIYVNPEDVLPKRIRNRELLKETFGGYLDRSLDAAERMLDQLEVLERRLPVWKSFARGADVPRIEPIMDFHDSEK
jgi:ribosomal protein L20A (L18A)